MTTEEATRAKEATKLAIERLVDKHGDFWLRDCLFQEDFDALRDDPEDFLADCLWLGADIPGFKDTPTDKLIEEAVERWFEEEDIDRFLHRVIEDFNGREVKARRLLASRSDLTPDRTIDLDEECARD